MKQGALLTHEQCSTLAGKIYMDFKYFIYDHDANGNFYLPKEQIDLCTEQDYIWVKDLPIVEYQPQN